MHLNVNSEAAFATGSKNPNTGPNPNSSTWRSALSTNESDEEFDKIDTGTTLCPAPRPVRGIALHGTRNSIIGGAVGGDGVVRRRSFIDVANTCYKTNAAVNEFARRKRRGEAGGMENAGREGEIRAQLNRNRSLHSGGVAVDDAEVT